MALRSALEDLVAGVPNGGAVTVPVNWLRRLLEEDPTDDGGPDLDVGDVARQVGRQPSTVRTWCAEGKLLGAYRLGGREWRIPRSSVREFIRSQVVTEGEHQETEVDDSLGSWRDELPGEVEG